MKQIQLVGPVDKRAIAYPLFKMCDTMGKTLVVTDDANFRRFSDDYSNEFTLGRSDFVITNDISQAIIGDLGVKLNTYDYVIFINTNDLIDNNDCLVYYNNADISSGGIGVISHDKTYSIRGLGVKTLDSIEKYQVDVLGNVSKVGKEKRMGFGK